MAREVVPAAGEAALAPHTAGARARTRRGPRGRLAADLFPDLSTYRRRAPWWTGLLVLLLGAAGFLFRVPPKDLNTLWAEDGRVFLQGAVQGHGGSTIFQTYSGYLQIFPRLVAALAARLPLEWAGLVFSLTAALVVGLASWSVWHFGVAHVPNPWLRAGLAAAVPLIPAGGMEAVNNVANSHWFLMFAAFWALLASRPGAGAQAIAVTIVITAALSDPLTIVLLPLVVGRAALLRSRRDWTTTAAYLIAIAAQLLVALSTHRTTGRPPTLLHTVYGYALRVVATSVSSTGGARHVLAAGGPAAIWLLAGAMAIGLAVAFVFCRRGRWSLAAAAVASLAYFVVESRFALGTPYPPSSLLDADFVEGSRYTLVPALLLVTAWVIAAQGLSERLPAVVAPAAVAAALIPIVLFGVYDYRPSAEQRAGMASWPTEVEHARQACMAAPAQHAELLVVAPGAPWTVQISCTTLRASG